MVSAIVAQKPDGRVARRGSTRELVIDAATALFAARGVTATSIDDIAERAGIAKGSIYYNFASKAGLVEAIMEQDCALLAASLDRARAGRSGDVLRAAVVREVLGLIQQHPDSARVMASELFRTERSWRESIETWRGIALSPLVDDLLATRPGLDPVEAALEGASIVGATLMTGLEWLVFHPERDYEEVAAAVLRTLGLAGADEAVRPA